MIKLVKVPEWVYMNCIYDKKIGSKLTEILRNISEWESSGKIRYQFDIDENMDIINKNNLMNLPPASVLEDINNSKEIEQPIFPTKINDSIDYIMTININHDIINDMMFFINYILRNMTDPLTGARNQEITKFYINHDDNFYFSSPNRFFGEDILSAFFDSSIYKSVSDSIAANDEYICIKLKIKNVIISQHDKVTNPNNTIKILDNMIN